MPRTATSTFAQLLSSDKRCWVVECCFTSTETVGLLGTGSPGRKNVVNHCLEFGSMVVSLTLFSHTALCPNKVCVYTCIDNYASAGGFTRVIVFCVRLHAYACAYTTQ